MKLPEAGKIEIAPSILNSDLADLASQVKMLDEQGIKIVHLDVMDGHFVPNLTFGPPVVECLRKHSSLCFDAHLMISDPDKYAPAFAKAGADNITFHIETTNDPKALIDKIHDMGCTAGISLNPATPVSDIAEYIPFCEMILVMTINPGFGGQKFMPDTADKIKQIREIGGSSLRIQVDGGINTETVKTVVDLGADTLVVGSAIFCQQDKPAAIRAIQQAAIKSV